MCIYTCLLAYHMWQMIQAGQPASASPSAWSFGQSGIREIQWEIPKSPIIGLKGKIYRKPTNMAIMFPLSTDTRTQGTLPWGVNRVLFSSRFQMVFSMFKITRTTFETADAWYVYLTCWHAYKGGSHMIFTISENPFGLFPKQKTKNATVHAMECHGFSHDLMGVIMCNPSASQKCLRHVAHVAWPRKLLFRALLSLAEAASANASRIPRYVINTYQICQ